MTSPHRNEHFRQFEGMESSTDQDRRTSEKVSESTLRVPDLSYLFPVLIHPHHCCLQSGQRLEKYPLHLVNREATASHVIHTVERILQPGASKRGARTGHTRLNFPKVNIDTWRYSCVQSIEALASQYIVSR